MPHRRLLAAAAALSIVAAGALPVAAERLERAIVVITGL